jgi:hypothetical protein
MCARLAELAQSGARREEQVSLAKMYCTTASSNAAWPVSCADERSSRVTSTGGEAAAAVMKSARHRPR